MQSRLICTLIHTLVHKLFSLEKENEGIRNYSVAVTKKGDDIKFLHKIVEGGTDNSYGIQVAKLAGLPQKVIDAAKKTLKNMELESKIDLEKELREEESLDSLYDFSALARKDAIQMIRNLDMDDMTPREAFTKLEEIKRMID